MGRMIIFLLLVTGIIGGMNFYAGSRIFQVIVFIFPQVNRLIYIVVNIFIAISFIFGKAPLPVPSGIKGLIGWIGAYWMGILIYLFLFFLLTDVILLIANTAKLIPAHMFLTVRFYAGTAVIILAMGAAAFGLFNARRTIFVSYDVKLNKNLSEEMKIAFIADMHLGEINSEKRLKGIIQGINSLNPDIVCIAGDIFNDDIGTIQDPGRASALLKSIRTRYGVYAVLGNHDGGRTLNDMMDFLEQSNVRLLNDEYAIIDKRLVLIGRLDSSPIGGFGQMRRKHFSEVMTHVDASLPLVVMDHNPANISQYGSETDLILAGHTHRGQLFPANIITHLLYTVDYGYYQKDSGSPQVIVTQGVNTWMMPMRVGTNSEIVSITVR